MPGRFVLSVAARRAGWSRSGGIAHRFADRPRTAGGRFSIDSIPCAFASETAQSPAPPSRRHIPTPTTGARESALDRRSLPRARPRPRGQTGRKYATLRNAPPTSSRSNHMPDSHAATLVSTAPQMPPTCLTLSTLPNSSPSAMYSSDTGTVRATAPAIFAVGGSPIPTATK